VPGGCRMKCQECFYEMGWWRIALGASSYGVPRYSCCFFSALSCWQPEKSYQWCRRMKNDDTVNWWGFPIHRTAIASRHVLTGMSWASSGADCAHHKDFPDLSDRLFFVLPLSAVVPSLFSSRTGYIPWILFDRWIIKNRRPNFLLLFRSLLWRWWGCIARIYLARAGVLSLFMVPWPEESSLGIAMMKRCRLRGTPVVNCSVNFLLSRKRERVTIWQFL